jgi:hypothetical protein
MAVYKNKFTLIHFFLAITLISPKIGVIDFPVIFMVTIVLLSSLNGKIKTKFPIQFYQITLLWFFLI